MKVLVATAETQGTRANDFTGCIDGELVWMLDPCPLSQRDPDGPCDCGRTFSGMSSLGSTTTARVQDVRKLTQHEYETVLRASFDAAGWCPCCTKRSVSEVVKELIVLASGWPVGAVIERHLSVLDLRPHIRAKAASDT